MEYYINGLIKATLCYGDDKSEFPAIIWQNVVNWISNKSMKRLMGYMKKSIYGLVNLDFIIVEYHNFSENVDGSLRYRIITKSIKLFMGYMENPIHGFM
jgi:hypothetical protein